MPVTEYFVPTAPSETEFVEKRSRFIGHCWPVESEEEARGCIEAMRKGYHDARHNCWCYILKEGGIVRYSDDGEPQGTAGQPMLGVFQKEGVENVCCVVTRYFGGTLLGAGGLVRAYTRSAKDALEGAGISVVRPWSQILLDCPYHLFERMKQEVERGGGTLQESEYGVAITVHALFPTERVAEFLTRVTEISAGGVVATVVGETVKAAPVIR